MCTIRVLAHGAAHAPLPRSMLEWRTECAQAMQNFAAPARNAWCPWTRLAAQWTQWKLRKHRNHNFTRHRLQQVNLGDGVRHPSLHLLCALPEAGQRRGRHVARFTTSARPSAAACPGRFHGCVRVKLEVYDLTWPNPFLARCTWYHKRAPAFTVPLPSCTAFHMPGGTSLAVRAANVYRVILESLLVYFISSFLFLFYYYFLFILKGRIITE